MSAPMIIPIIEYNKIGIRVEDDTVQISINNHKLLKRELSGLVRGSIGLGSLNDSAYFDDLHIRSLTISEPDLPPQAPSGVILRRW